MLKILDGGARLEYTKNDTFNLTVTADEADENSILQFVISNSESSAPIINESFTYEDEKFSVTLSQDEKNALNIGNYIFKMILISDDTVVTYLSGDFIVKWGA